MAGNSMKITGAYILIVVSFLAIILTWELKLLTPLGGIFIVGVSFIGAILMWQDAAESLQGVGKENVNRAKADR
jgi:CHASE2 domain-containing sensor protein